MSPNNAGDSWGAGQVGQGHVSHPPGLGVEGGRANAVGMCGMRVGGGEGVRGLLGQAAWGHVRFTGCVWGGKRMYACRAVAGYDLRGGSSGNEERCCSAACGVVVGQGM